MLIDNDLYAVARLGDSKITIFMGPEDDDPYIPPQPVATRVTLTGPAQITIGVVSAPFTVTANAAPAESFTVTPIVVGGGGAVSGAVALNPTTLSGTFTVTASGSPGVRSIRLSNNSVGGIANPEDFATNAIGQPVDNTSLNTRWLYDVSPVRVFRASQGTVPAQTTGRAGDPNLCVAIAETVADATVNQWNVDSSDSALTATALQYGRTVTRNLNGTRTANTSFGTDNYECVKRVPDPLNGAKWAYQFRVHRDHMAWYRSAPGEGPPDWFRAEMGPTGSTRWVPWGTEEWAVTAYMLGTEWATVDGGHVHFQMHDYGGGLTHNPPFAMYWQGGGAGGVDYGWTVNLRKYFCTPAQYAANAAIRSDRMIYPAGNTLPAREWHRVVDGVVTNQVIATNKYTNGYFPSNPNNAPLAASGRILNPTLGTGRWHYCIAQYRYGCGPYVDPASGSSAIYNTMRGVNGQGIRPMTPSDVFARFWYAHSADDLDTTPPRLILNHTGYWSSPHANSSSEKGHAGYWKGGVYTGTSFTRGGVERLAYTKGIRVWRASDLPPGVDAVRVLKAFLADR